MNYEFWKKTKQMKPFESVEDFEQFEHDLVSEMGSSGIARMASMRRPAVKKGTALGVSYDSFAEFVFYTYMTRVNLASVERNYREHVLLYYDENNKQHKYYPDFVVDGELAEVKGRFGKKDMLKKEQHPEVKWYFQPDIDEMAAKLDQTFGRSWRDDFVQTNITQN